MPNLESLNDEEENTIIGGKFRVLFDSFNHAIFLFNFSGGILDVNNKACRLLNHTRENLLKMTLHDIFSSEFASKLPEGIQETFRTKSRTFESGLRSRKGRIIPVELFMTIIELNNTNIIFITAQENSELKTKNKKLEELNKVVNNFPNPLLRVKNNIVIYANKIATEIFNTKENGIIAPIFRESIAEAEKSKSTITATIEIKNLMYILDIIPAQDEKSYTIYGRDITAHQKAEKMIDYLASFPSENPNPVLWVSKDSVLYSNQAGENLFNVKRNSKIPEFLKTAVEKALFNNEYSEKEVKFDNKIYLLNISKVKNKDFISIQGIDISERKKAEEMLQQYSHQMEFLNHIIMAGNVASEISLFLEEILSSTLQLMRFDVGVIYLIAENEITAEIVSSQNISQDLIANNKVIRCAQEPYKTIFIKGLPLFIEGHAKLYSKDVLFSNFWAIASIPIFSKEKIIGSINIASKNMYKFSNEEKELLELIGREIGAFIEKMKTEEALNEARSITEFYKDLVVHDISNILQNISMSVEVVSLFQGKEEKIDEIFELVGNVKEQIIRGSNLITNIRKLSKISSTGINLEPVEARQLLNNAIKFIQVSFPNKDLNIQIESPIKKVFVRANEFLLDVFENILFNAVKYNDNLSVEIVIRILKEKQSGKEYLRIEFIDNGIGISDQRKATILDSVSEGKTKVKGMGIGLFTVNKIIKSFDGNIRIEDRIKENPSKGSNFIILIPLNA